MKHQALFPQNDKSKKILSAVCCNFLHGALRVMLQFTVAAVHLILELIESRLTPII